MSLLMVRDVSGTPADNDALWDRLERSGVALPPDGLQVHVVATSPSGLRIVEVWESREAFAAFGPKILPVVAELGLPQVCPQIGVVHQMITTASLKDGVKGGPSAAGASASRG